MRFMTQMTRWTAAAWLIMMMVSCADTNFGGKSAKKNPSSDRGDQALPSALPITPGAPISTTSVTVRDGIGRIVCTKRDLMPTIAAGSANEVYTRDFRAEECGGKLPNSEFFGFSADEEICGADRDWTILEPRNGQKAGISVRYIGSCPGPVNPSMMSVVWVHRDSAMAAGEASAASSDQLKERVKSRTNTITCRKTNFNPGTATTSGARQVIFAASECTANQLPDNSYIGLLGKRQVCGLNESWTQPAPGTVDFWYLGSIQPCGDPSEASDIEVLYILK